MKKAILSVFALLVFLSLSAQEYGVVNISVCNLRSTPDFDAEMVSQALLGTPVHIIGNSDSKPYPWPEIDTPDDYSGWVHYAANTQNPPPAAQPYLMLWPETGSNSSKSAAHGSRLSSLTAVRDGFSVKWQW